MLFWKPFTIGSPPPKLSLYGSLSLDEDINQYITSPGWIVDLFEQRVVELGFHNSELCDNICNIVADRRLFDQVWIGLAQTELLLLNRRAADIVIKCLQLQFHQATTILTGLREITSDD